MFKRMIKNIDYAMALASVSILTFSLIIIGSATLEFTDASFTKLKDMNIILRLFKLDYEYVTKQFVWILLGITAMAAILYIDYEDMGKYSKYLYVINLVLLLAVLFMGRTALGAQRWIAVGPFQFQPSEFSKLIIIITFADFLVKREGRLDRLRDLIPCFLFVGVPMLLVLMQPDLGTSLVFMAITFGMLFAAGARPALLAGIIALGLLTGVSIYNVHSFFHKPDIAIEQRMTEVKKAVGSNPLYIETNKEIMEDLQKRKLTTQKGDLQKYYNLLAKEHETLHSRHEKFHKVTLKEYQMTRLTIFMNPESDLLGAGYHVWQSRIALGSGGITGKGLLGGTQSHYTFLPIRHTDFIFSVVGEEFGFIGSFVLLGLFFVILYRGIQVAIMARDTYGTLLATGVVSMFAFHILINIGMTAGVMPVTGIPLPLFSYGGSNMIMNLAALGILMNVYSRRQKLIF